MAAMAHGVAAATRRSSVGGLLDAEERRWEIGVRASAEEVRTRRRRIGREKRAQQRRRVRG